MSKFSNQTIPELISSINYSIKELGKRGIHLTNFDDTNEQLKGISMLGGKVKYVVSTDSQQGARHATKDGPGNM